MKKKIINDDPDNLCFGCSPHNASGLNLVFYELAPGLVECPYTAAAHLSGAPGVIHGGVQSTLLDEVIGMSIHSALGDEDRNIVTVDFQLRYRRPAPTEVPLTVRGRYLRRDGRQFFAEAEIVDSEGEVLTRGEARWFSV